MPFVCIHIHLRKDFKFHSSAIFASLRLWFLFSKTPVFH